MSRGLVASKSLAAGVVAAAVVGVAGRGARVEVWLLSAIAAIVFTDLMRRGLAECEIGPGDPTDVSVSAAFVAILAAGAFDVGRAREATLGEMLPWRLSGSLVLLAGFALRQWAARTMAGNFLVRLEIRSEHALVREGPFQLVRHPTYAGLALVAIGTSLALASLSAFAVAAVVWFPLVLLRLEREERRVAAAFGAEHEAWRRRTWKLVPGVY